MCVITKCLSNVRQKFPAHKNSARCVVHVPGFLGCAWVLLLVWKKSLRLSIRLAPATSLIVHAFLVRQGTRCGGSVAKGQKGTSMAIKAEAPDSWQERSESGDGQEDRAEETESEDDEDDVPALDALNHHLFTPQAALNGCVASLVSFVSSLVLLSRLQSCL